MVDLDITPPTITISGGGGQEQLLHVQLEELNLVSFSD